jgi:hypothetical protein
VELVNALKDLTENSDLEKQSRIDAFLLLLCYFAFAIFGYFLANHLGF